MLDTEPQIIEQYIASGKVRLVYRHLTQLGEISQYLAEVSECAADQGKFWEMRRAIYAAQGQMYADAQATVARLASDLGLDPPALQSCVDAGTHRAAVEADYAASIREGIRARPVFALGEQRLIGAQRFSIFQEALDSSLAGQ